MFTEPSHCQYQIMRASLCIDFNTFWGGGKDYSPHICYLIQYGQKIKYEYPLDAAEYLSDKETNLIQQVSGTFLYYSTAIDNTILPSLSNISPEQFKAKKNTAKQVTKILNYLASNKNVEIQYRASGMQLAVHSNLSYLLVSQAIIRASGVNFLS